jgi:hypothetical protein
MLSSAEIQKITSDSFKGLFQDSFPQLNHTSIGTPIPVFDQNYVQQYWFVPFLLKSKVRGSALFDVNGKLVTHGVLSPNVQDEHKLTDKAFFEKVPEHLLAEVRNSYKDFEIVSHFFSFDQTPQKWGWLIYLKNGSSQNLKKVFVNPGGWYEKNRPNDSEG